MEWRPATIRDVTHIVEADLAKCDARQRATFQKYSVKPYGVPILRYGNLESVFVVARRADEVVYWEDIEGGFNVSRLGPDGQILEHSCNQDDLGIALNHWIEGREGSPRMGPSERVT
jgi:hypothetical protein